MLRGIVSGLGWMLPMTYTMKKLPVSFLFEGQLQHLLLLAGLLPGAIYLASPALGGSTWLGIPDTTWFDFVIFIAILHQVVGWFVFRTQLVFASSRVRQETPAIRHGEEWRYLLSIA